jgi:hypothetical protein
LAERVVLEVEDEPEKDGKRKFRDERSRRKLLQGFGPVELGTFGNGLAAAMLGDGKQEENEIADVFRAKIAFFPP